MDKYEYKVRADEIKALISEGEYAEAVSIADTIDWRRVRSVMMLCTISDLYKINRRYRESMDILLLAYEKHPTGRLIVYSLCELSIKLEEYVQAIEYYKIFVQIAPKDTGRYILQYRLYEAQDVSLEERIAVLEEFKKRDYREKWAYELAYLYHRIGLATKCVEECDEMFLWFGEGKYVIKALELKALHGSLSESQQAQYDAWIRERDAGDNPTEEESSEEENETDDVSGDTRVVGRIEHMEEEHSDEQTVSDAPTMELPEVKTVDVGQYNTINLQMALAESMKEILAEDVPQEPSEEEQESDEIAEPVYEAQESESVAEIVSEEEEEPEEITETVIEEEEPEEITETVYEEEEEPEEDDEDKEHALITESLIAPLLEETAKMPSSEEVEEQIRQASVIPFPEQPVSEEEQAETEIIEPDEDIEIEEDTQTEQEEGIEEAAWPELDEDIADVQANDYPEEESDSLKTVNTMNTDDLQEISAQIAEEDTVAFDAQQIVEQMKQEAQQALAAAGTGQMAETITDVFTPQNANSPNYDNFLSQEYDGQISLVMPETAHVEKQITGQLSIDDIMAEWEEMKRTSEQRRMEEVRQRILAQTGNLLADFDEATQNGLLEEMERAYLAVMKEDSDKKPAVKQVILPEDDVEETTVLSPEEPDTAVSDAYVESDEALPEDDIEDGVEELEEIEEPEEIITEGSIEAEPVEDIQDTTEQAAEEVFEPEEESASQGEEISEESLQESVQDRGLTAEEQALFGQFTRHSKSKRQLVQTLDNMSLAACTGNVIVTGEEEITTLTLAKALIKEMQYSDKNFSGKVAKISANVLNKKDVAETFARLDNGALIIEQASRLKPLTVSKMTKVLEKDNMGLLIIMIDKKQDINQLLADHTELNNNFNLRMDIEPLNDEALVAYAKQYAEEMEYSIDEFGILALHTRIADRQTSDHEVSMAEVRELVDEAIRYANKKTPKHFMDILLAKMYDEKDMIILREKDFMHY